MNALIGEQIRTIREKRNVTQEQIADYLGMTRQRFSRIEKGLSDISYDIIVRIAEYLKVTPGDITSVCEQQSQANYRAGNASAETFGQIEEIINFFYANKALNNRIHPENNDE